MKRILILFLTLLLIPLAGCQKDTTQLEYPVTVYYKRAEPTHGTADSVIASTTIEGKGHEKDYSYLLSRYLKGSDDPHFARTFPRGTTLVSFKLDALTAKIVLGYYFSSLSEMDLTIACVCLARTIMELTGCQEVIISAENTQLNGQNFIILSADSYVLTDTFGIQ